VDSALDCHVSSSTVAIASKYAIENQSAAFGIMLRSYGPRIRLVRIHGAVFEQDHRALVSCTRQLLAAAGTSNFSRNMNALEAELEESFDRKRPLVVLVEDLHEFCRKDKQVLLYSLLDLLHKQRALSVVCTHAYIRCSIHPCS
jgi:Cdc6-like AAA superfamily ATPase